MTGDITKEPERFMASPFGDAFFREIAALSGYEDDGRKWPEGVNGYRSIDDHDHPEGMPHFFFTQGTEDYDGTLSIGLEGMVRVSYMHTSLTHPHLIMHDEALPDSMWSALENGPMSALLDLPFSARWSICATRRRETSLINYRDIRIVPLA